jgi:large subunit ribosomal protein L37Ae
MGRTKKVGSAGKFGTRYGTKIRQRVNKVNSLRNKKCPECLKNTVTRESAGIWKCKKCGLKFAGKAYTQ